MTHPNPLRWTFFFIMAPVFLPAIHAGDTQEIPVRSANTNPLSFFDGKVVLDGEERVRYEARNNNRDFNTAVKDDNDAGWVLNRFRLGLQLKPCTWLKAYVQTQDSREWFSPRLKIPGVHSAEGDDTFDLRQGYVVIGDLDAFPLTLSGGRQSLQYGDRRLLGDSLWSNLGRTFDAVRGHFVQPGLWVDAFVARPVQLKRGAFDDSDAADNLTGVYLSTTRLAKQTTELYVFYRDKADNQPDLSPSNNLDPNGLKGFWNGPAVRFFTFGTRVESKPGELRGWDYNGEFAYEIGDVWQTDRNSQRSSLHAFAAHSAGGYTFEQASWKPRIGIEYDYATGDHAPGSGKSESFQNLFPGNHEKYGFMDEFAWRNMHDARVQLNFQPMKKLDVELDYHAFWLADTNDYWYRSNGLTAQRTVMPSGQDVRTAGASNFAGQEFDLTLTYTFSKNVKLQTGYSHFFSGTYLADTGTSSDADFGYAMLTLDF